MNTTTQIPPRAAVGGEDHCALTVRSGTDWSIAAPLALAHLVALAAPWTFTWAGFLCLVSMYLVSGFGVTAGAHRLFTHVSFVAKPILRRALAVMFLLSAQGSLLRWVRDHHIHHAYADHPGDPHSPKLEGGFWHAHLTWLWEAPASREENKRLYQRFGGGLHSEALLRNTARGEFLLGFHLVVMAIVYAAGALSEAGFVLNALWVGWQTGLSCVVWGVFLRIILVLHATSFVNSAAHLWGYRTYTTREGSRNNWWVAIVSLGEGWHNNHHGRPAAANQGFHRWWEVDVTFIFLLVMGWVGLASDMRVYRPRVGKTEVWFKRTGG
ncbi:MAG: acyl-CoA desaturase [Bacteroidia bacterium]